MITIFDLFIYHWQNKVHIILLLTCLVQKTATNNNYCCTTHKQSRTLDDLNNVVKFASLAFQSWKYPVTLSLVSWEQDPRNLASYSIQEQKKQGQLGCRCGVCDSEKPVNSCTPSTLITDPCRETKFTGPRQNDLVC